MPAKLLFLCNSPDVPAGVERSILVLLEHIDRERFSPRVILNGAGPFCDALTKRSEDVEVIPCGRLPSAGWMGRLRRSLEERPVDVVQLHLSRINAWFLRRWGCTVVERLNMTRHSSFLYPMRWRWLDLVSSRWCDHFIVVSESLRTQFIERGYPKDKLAVVHNGVASPGTVDREKIRRELGVARETRLVGAVGRLTAQKGMDTFIAAAGMVAKKIENVEFVIAGDGELRDDLEQQAAAAGIADKVHFLGFRTDVIDVLASLDVLAYLSRWEPFANTLLEAMAVETPIVATAVGGNEEAIEHGQDGLLVRAEDPSEAAGEITRLLQDSERSRDLARNALESVKRFSVSAMVSGHEEVYARMLSATSRSATET